MNPIAPHIRRADPPPVGAPSVGASGRPSIELKIDALVFHGLSRGDGQRASVAFQQELIRLLATEDLAALSNAMAGPRPHVDAGMIRASGAQPELTGRRAAQALFGGLQP